MKKHKVDPSKYEPDFANSPTPPYMFDFIEKKFKKYCKKITNNFEMAGTKCQRYYLNVQTFIRILEFKNDPRTQHLPVPEDMLLGIIENVQPEVRFTFIHYYTVYYQTTGIFCQYTS